jgi:perosamine synthetase
MQIDGTPTSPKIHKIEFYKPTLSKEELKTVLECLVEDQLYTGSIVSRFEKEFKSTFQLKHTISTNSLMAAYHLSLLSLGVSEGDKIAVSSLAPIQAFDAISLVKAIPIVLDIGRSSFHIDPEQIRQRATSESIKVIIIDHTFGCLMDWKSYNITGIPIIEDFSEALGADSSNIEVGRLGTISICGLSENHIITIGNGAMIHTSTPEIAEKIRSLKLHSKQNRKPFEVRFDYDLIDFQAAIGIEQLSKLGIILERKRKIAQLYLQAVLSSSHETYFKRAGEDLFNRFPVVISKSYEEVNRYFNSLQIETQRISNPPLHKLMDLPAPDYPNAERLYQRSHCIPIYPNLNKDNVSRIASSLRGIF